MWSPAHVTPTVTQAKQNDWNQWTSVNSHFLNFFALKFSRSARPWAECCHWCFSNLKECLNDSFGGSVMRLPCRTLYFYLILFGPLFRWATSGRTDCSHIVTFKTRCATSTVAQTLDRTQWSLQLKTVGWAITVSRMSVVGSGHSHYIVFQDGFTLETVKNGVLRKYCFAWAHTAPDPAVTEVHPFFKYRSPGRVLFTQGTEQHWTTTLNKGADSARHTRKGKRESNYHIYFIQYD